MGRFIIRLAEQGAALSHPIVQMHGARKGNSATVAARPAIIQVLLRPATASSPCDHVAWTI